MIRAKRAQWCWPMLLPSWCTRWVGGQISFSLFEILQGGGQPQSQHKTSGLRAFRLTSDAVWRIVNFLSPNQERAQEVRKSPKSFEQLEKEKAINKWKTSKVRDCAHALFWFCVWVYCHHIHPWKSSLIVIMKSSKLFLASPHTCPTYLGARRTLPSTRGFPVFQAILVKSERD